MDERTNLSRDAVIVTFPSMGLVARLVVDQKRKRRREDEADADVWDEAFLDEDWTGDEDDQESPKSFEEETWNDHVDEFWGHDSPVSSDTDDGNVAVLTAPRVTVNAFSGTARAVRCPVKKPRWRTFVNNHAGALLLTTLFAFFGFAYFRTPSRQSISTPAISNASVVQPPAPRLESVNIEDIRKDDYILAKDPITGEMAPRKVLKTFSRISDHVRYLILRSSSGIDQEVGTTDEHPFFVEGNIEVKAGQLRIGDKIIQHDGNFAILTTSHREEHPEGIAVYNFEVEGFHTYFVSAQGSRAPPVWVHNADCVPKGPTQDAIDRAARKTLPPRSADEIAASRAQWLEKYGPKPNQMNQQIYRGTAPRTITRVDTPKIPGEQLHVHLEGGQALNIDGTWKHGGRPLTSAEVAWLRLHNWPL